MQFTSESATITTMIKINARYFIPILFPNCLMGQKNMMAKRKVMISLESIKLLKI